MTPYRLLFPAELTPPATLRQLEQYELCPCPSLEQATEQLMSDPPEGLLLSLDLAAKLSLELLGALEVLNLRIPTLLLASTSRTAQLPVPLSPFLQPLDPDMPAVHLERELEGTLRIGQRITLHRMFRVIDYLQLAVLMDQSINLHLMLQGSDTIQFKIIGGDIWSAFTASHTGDQAITFHFLDSPTHVEVKPIEMLPKDRQLRAPGLTILHECARRVAQQHSAPSSTDSGNHPKTQPLPTEELKQLFKTPTPPPPPQEAAGDPFDVHFKAGMDAALVRDYTQALEQFEKARQLRPTEQRVLFNIERIRQRLQGS